MIKSSQAIIGVCVLIATIAITASLMISGHSKSDDSDSAANTSPPKVSTILKKGH